MNQIQRPGVDEFAPFYQIYINSVPDGDIIDIIQNQFKVIHPLFGSLSEDQGNFRYADGKWSLKEVIGHMADTERVFSYRLLRIARGDDTTPLPGFEQNAFVSSADFNRLPLSEISNDFTSVRGSTLSLLKSLPDAAWERRGIVSNNVMTVRANVYIITGHVFHHLQIIRERYLHSV